jgi:sterol 3beta-glucosyltransferase
MKVLMLTLGTRGDVQPFVALALELKKAGHEAVLAAPEMFEAFVTGYGVEFAALDDGPMRLMGTTGVREAMEGGVRARVALARQMPKLFDGLLESAWAVASEGPGAGADMVVHNGQVVAGQHVAEKLRVPAILALPIPMYVPTREFPWPGQSLPARLPAAMNRITFLGMKAVSLVFGRTVDAWRQRTLGLPRRRGRHDPLRRPDGGPAPVLHAFSPHVVPPPSDWPRTVTTTGYWFLPSETGAEADAATVDVADASPRTEASAGTLPDGLADFLEAGELAVFVGFGSMAGTDPERTATVVAKAIRRARMRAVLATGWGGLEAGSLLPDEIFVADQIPYERLFPRVAAIVHHGGAGTTGTAVAAGRPQVVCPFVADQPFWARRMHDLGVAPAPIPQRELTAEGLAGALRRAVDGPEMHARAEELGHLVRAERGAAVAVDTLEEIHAYAPG